MSRKKLVAYRLPESLIQMIKETALIMDRTEADTVRILLYRACRYWLTKKVVDKMPYQDIVRSGNAMDAEIEAQQEELESLLAGIAHLK
jgi:hypothetical protein